MQFYRALYEFLKSNWIAWYYLNTFTCDSLNSSKDPFQKVFQKQFFREFFCFFLYFSSQWLFLITFFSGMNFLNWILEIISRCLVCSSILMRTNQFDYAIELRNKKKSLATDFSISRVLSTEFELFFSRERASYDKGE